MPLPQCGCYTYGMETDAKNPKRKPLRLKHYDYSAPGAYFITICTDEKRCILSTIRMAGSLAQTFVGDGLARPVVKLTNVGYIVEHQIEDIPKRFPTVSVDAYVIMPNHVHLLISLDGGAGGASPSPTVFDVMRAFKSLSTRQARSYLGEKPLWQRAYYDHIIRNEKDHSEIWAYIEYNPLRWAEDSLYAEE